MATFNLAIQYPDDQGPRILAALRAHYRRQDAEGNPVEATNAQAIEAFRMEVRNQLRGVVDNYERSQREAKAPAPPYLT